MEFENQLRNSELNLVKFQWYLGTHPSDFTFGEWTALFELFRLFAGRFQEIPKCKKIQQEWNFRRVSSSWQEVTALICLRISKNIDFI